MQLDLLLVSLSFKGVIIIFSTQTGSPGTHGLRRGSGTRGVSLVSVEVGEADAEIQVYFFHLL